MTVTDRGSLTHLVRLTSDEQRRTVHRFREQAEVWLRERGADQFQPESDTQASQAHAIIDRVFDAGEFVGLEINSSLVAVGAVTDPDPDFWTEDERADPQVYVGRLLVASHGSRYGTQLLAKIAQVAVDQGAPVMRLDCWRSSKGLHDYYRRLGFRHLRTVPVTGRGSGALFELDITKDNGLM